MSDYKKILVVVDYTPESKQVIARAKDVVKQYDAELILAHVVEVAPIVTGPEAFTYMDLYADQQALVEIAKQDLNKFAEVEGLSDVKQEIRYGIAKDEIIEIAENEQVELIILGSHGRHGIGLLLGSTANAVLHHAKCDVLAVRIKA